MWSSAVVTLGGAVVPLVLGKFAELDRGEFEAENDDFVVKIRAISWMEGGENWGDARFTSNKANP